MDRQTDKDARDEGKSEWPVRREQIQSTNILTKPHTGTQPHTGQEKSIPAPPQG